ncbi:MAG: adenylate kinase family protein, partial [bacterium]
MSVMYMLFLGAPGSGKGTHARKLSDEFGMFHLSSGLLLRKAARRKTSGGQVIKRYLTRGRLVPDEITVKLLEREIIKFKEKDIIFDGFPRTISQAEKLDEILSELDKKLDLCIHLEVAK